VYSNSSRSPITLLGFHSELYLGIAAKIIEARKQSFHLGNIAIHGEGNAAPALNIRNGIRLCKLKLQLCSSSLQSIKQLDSRPVGMSGMRGAGYFVPRLVPAREFEVFLLDCW
jgi:hypothetical protein